MTDLFRIIYLQVSELYGVQYMVKCCPSGLANFTCICLVEEKKVCEPVKRTK